ncbi:MAG TPA: MarR family transcriptional regulator [Methanomassiliicoccales archaeon]|jgi:CRISPR locus-related DNA-binding protein
MVVILGTLGHHPETLLPTIRSTKGVDEVVVFHSDHENSIKAVEEIGRTCHMMEVAFSPRQIPDAFDLVSTAKEIQKTILELRTENKHIAVFNIAGGTRIMSASALLVCTLEGLNAVYVHDDSHKEIPLPLLQIKYSDILTEREKLILRFLLANKGKEVTQRDLADELHLHKATVNHHVKQLIDKRAIHLEDKVGDKRVRPIRVEDSMALLLR